LLEYRSGDRDHLNRFARTAIHILPVLLTVPFNFETAVIEDRSRTTGKLDSGGEPGPIFGPIDRFPTVWTQLGSAHIQGECVDATVKSALAEITPQPME
jgi:hypothetical protein